MHRTVVLRPGQTIYFKAAGGLVGAVATAQNVQFMDQLSPQAIHQIARQYNDRILGTPTFWQDRRHCRYCTLVFLADIRPIRPAVRHFDKKAAKAGCC